MDARSLVIVNPNASQVRDPARRADVVARLQQVLAARDGMAPRIVETAQPSDTAPAVAAAVADGVAAVIGVGGDGTQRAVAGALAGSGVPLGIVSGGTGNQLAAVLGLPLSAIAAADALARTGRRTIDLGEATVHLTDGRTERSVFIIGCGAGFDARLMATTPPGWKQRLGKAAYFLQALRLATTVDVLPYRITVDGETFETEASIALVGNMGQLVPGRLDLRLPIDPADGLLDILVVGARGPIHGMKGLVDQLTRTSLGGGAGMDSLRVRGHEVAIEADRPEPLQVDGDYVGEGHMAARILPAALDVLVPLRD